MSYNEELQSNNADLQAILDSINELPDVNPGGSGGSVEVTLLGSTPQKLTKAGTVKLACDSECAYSIDSDTVAVFDILSGTKSKISTVTQEDGMYKIQADGTATGWYEMVLTIPLTGLVVGETYNFIFDAAGVPFVVDSEKCVTPGHWILQDGNGNTLLSKADLDNNVKQVMAFTATTANVTLLWYVVGNYYFSIDKTVGARAVSYVNAIYINRQGTSELTDVLHLTGTFSGSTTIEGVPAGVTISANPTATVYMVIGGSSAGSARSRHEGKVCVCFGDSVTGNMASPYDYPTILAEETGMTVVNGGFGGCRMTDTHPTAAYAAFSMVKLADAVDTGDWSLQDTNVSGLSTTTHGVEHLAALKDVNWSKVDFVTIAYGTNDIQSAIGIDNSSNPLDTTKYLGALRYTITKILTKYPHIKMLLLTPIYRYWNDDDIDSDSKMFNGGTQHFTEWGDGLLKVAEEFKIPAVDMYRTLGFNSITRVHYFPANDGTHPNAKGLALMGGKIAAKLLAEY